jgi:hypothetical protein
MEVRLLTIIQKRFQKKLLYKKSKELQHDMNQIFLKITENYTDKKNVDEIEKDFDLFSKIIRDKILINKFQKFLDYLYKVYPEKKEVAKKISSKVFLSAFLMYGYPEILLDFSRKNIDTNIIKTINFDVHFYSKLLILNFVNFVNGDSFNEESLRKFIKYLNIYSNVFYLFMQEDKIKQINKVTYEYYQIKKTIKEINLSDAYEKSSKIEILENLNNTIKGLEEMLLIINPKYDLENLKFYEEILEKFDGIIHKSFWDKFKLDLDNAENDEIKKELIKSKLNEILEIYKSFNIKSISEKICLLEKFTNKFNIYNLEELIDYCDLCVNIILELQSPSRNQMTQTAFQEIKCHSYDNIIDVLIDVLKFIFKENEIIFRDIYNIRIMMTMGINPFLKK